MDIVLMAERCYCTHHHTEEQNSYAPPPRRHNNNSNNNGHRDRENHRSEQQQHTPPDPSRNHERRNYNIDNVGNNRVDSLKALALGLNSQATASEIKYQFRRLSLIYHPDKYSDALQISKEQATAHFQLINNAYNFLRRNR